MKKITDTKFSKIGTNPMCYFKNYQMYINHLENGATFNIEGLCLKQNHVEMFTSNSEATFRQNLDAWVWMGFMIKTLSGTYIKIIPQLPEIDLLEHAKYSILLNHHNKLVNAHRNTIIIKLLTLNDSTNKTYHPNYTYEEIKKEIGEFERIISTDREYIKLINYIWGDKND